MALVIVRIRKNKERNIRKRDKKNKIFNEGNNPMVGATVAVAVAIEEVLTNK